jgi:hypothetical protein
VVPQDVSKLREDDIPPSCQFIVELFSPEHQFLGASDWLALRRSTRGPPEPSVFIINTHGHYVAVLAARVEGRPTLVAYDTKASNNLPMPIFDLVKRFC